MPMSRGKPRDWQRAYRLSKTLWHYQIIRFDHDDAQMLRALAKREHISVSELVRRFVAWGFEEYEITDARRGRED
jgi:hypothetical protein